MHGQETKANWRFSWGLMQRRPILHHSPTTTQQVWSQPAKTGHHQHTSHTRSGTFGSRERTGAALSSRQASKGIAMATRIAQDEAWWPGDAHPQSTDQPVRPATRWGWGDTCRWGCRHCPHSVEQPACWPWPGCGATHSWRRIYLEKEWFFSGCIFVVGVTVLRQGRKDGGKGVEHALALLAASLPVQTPQTPTVASFLCPSLPPLVSR